MPLVGGQPQWNANYIPPGAEDSASGATGTARSPEELLRRLSLNAQIAPTLTSQPRDWNPRDAYPELGLSGNVISATFCVPYKIRYGSDGAWVSFVTIGSHLLVFD
jgi:hypothetical protein